MDEQELRARWEDQAGTKNRKLLDWLWETAKKKGYVDYALTEPETGLEDLLDLAKLPVEAYNLGTGRRQLMERKGPRQEIPFSLKGTEAERAAALEEHLA